MFYDINICFFSKQDWENHDTQQPTTKRFSKNYCEHDLFVVLSA